MRKNLILVMILNGILVSGCSSIFLKPHDKQIKSSCDVCKQAPFYVNGKRLSDTGYKR